MVPETNFGMETSNLRSIFNENFVKTSSCPSTERAKTIKNVGIYVIIGIEFESTIDQ